MIKLLTPGKPTLIQVGNEVTLQVLPKYPDGRVYDVTGLSNIVIKVGGAKTVYPHTISGQYICITLPSTEKDGVYDVWMEATIGNTPVVCGWDNLYARVITSNMIAYDTYQTDMIIVRSTDEQLEALREATEQARQNYVAATAEMNIAKADYIRKAGELSGVAKELKASANRDQILAAIANIDVDTSDLAKADDLAADTASILSEIGGVDDKVGTPSTGHTLAGDIANAATEDNATTNKNAILQAVDDKIEEIEYTDEDINTMWADVTYITFSINQTEYTAEEGMTWGDWIDSDYNTDGYIECGVYIHKSSYGSHWSVKYEYGGEEEEITFVIIENHDYSFDKEIV